MHISCFQPPLCVHVQLQMSSFVTVVDHSTAGVAVVNALLSTLRLEVPSSSDVAVAMCASRDLTSRSKVTLEAVLPLAVGVAMCVLMALSRLLHRWSCCRHSVSLQRPVSRGASGGTLPVVPSGRSGYGGAFDDADARMVVSF